VPRRARHAVHSAFFVFGAVVAALGVHVPSIRAHYRLDDARLSLALLCTAVGAVVCLVFAGRLIAAFGLRRVAAVAALAMASSLALLLQFAALPALMAVMVAFGASVGLFDVAINTEGTQLETVLERKVMSVMHGMWSLGGMAGALVCSRMLEQQVDAAWQLRAVAGVAVVVALGACPFMLPTHGGAGPDASASRLRTMPPAARRALIALGILAVLGLLAEGAIYDWIVLYLQRELNAAASLAALSYASFSAAMAAGRFGGDWLRERVAPARLLAASAALAALAMAVVLAAGQAHVALAGIAFVGFGLANVIPLLFVAASRVPGVSAAAGIALVSSLGWFGVVIGPPLVGGVAQLTSLTGGLLIVVLASLVLLTQSRRLRAT
jgi:fucose permease